MSNPVKQVRAPGRPREFEGAKEKSIVKVIRQMGLTKARHFLATEGVQVSPGQPKVIINISMPTLGKLAKRANIKLFRGRPKVAG